MISWRVGGSIQGMDNRRLMRSKTDRKIAGVAGGLAQYFGVDPTLVRVLWVLGLIGGFGFLAYIVLWIVVPEGEPESWRPSSAISIVEERYARGEIGAEEMARMKRDLEAR